jgi:hypothetical protein
MVRNVLQVKVKIIVSHEGIYIPPYIVDEDD